MLVIAEAVVTEDAQRAAVAAEAVPPSVRGEISSIRAYDSPHSCAGPALPHADRAFRPPTGGEGPVADGEVRGDAAGTELAGVIRASRVDRDGRKWGATGARVAAFHCARSR